jgi:hypothetical protein
MELYYSKGLLIGAHSEFNNVLPHITADQFEFLTGKRINWDKRESKNIRVLRDRGHVRLYDTHFIPGEKYKYRSGVYVCHHVDKDGVALLNKVGKNMVIKSAKTPGEAWEIA